jgi:radical SAM superfamily enzyme YgiQ (UPF0313 family)
MWPDPVTGQVTASAQKPDSAWLAPDINALPFVNRCYLPQDPHQENGRLEANMVGARGCPYNCSFCGARPAPTRTSPSVSATRKTSSARWTSSGPPG